MDSILCDDMVKIEILSRTSLKTLAAMRCINKDLEKVTYEPYLVDLYKKRNDIVSGFIMQFTLRGTSNYINEFAPSRGSSNIDLGFLPRDARIVASSEQGLIVYESSPCRWDSYFVCKPATKQVLRLPYPKTEYVTKNVAIIVLGSSPLHYKILRISETQNTVLELAEDECYYMTYRCEIFDSRTWAWKELNRLILPESAHLDNPQLPITTRGSIYMKLYNRDILKFDVYSEKWSVFSSPTSTLDYDQFYTRRELVKHEGRLGYICKPPNGDWEIWVVGTDETWEKMYVIKEKDQEDINSTEQSFSDPNTSIKISSHYYMVYKGNNVDSLIDTYGSQIFVYRSDFEPTNLMGDCQTGVDDI